MARTPRTSKDAPPPKKVYIVERANGQGTDRVTADTADVGPSGTLAFRNRAPDGPMGGKHRTLVIAYAAGIWATFRPAEEDE